MHQVATLILKVQILLNEIWVLTLSNMIYIYVVRSAVSFCRFNYLRNTILYLRDNLFPSLWRNSGSVKIFLSTFFTYSCYLNSKPGCSLQSFTTYLRQTLLSIWKSALRVKFSFYFSGDFCKYWQNFYFGSRSKHQTTRSFWDFSDVSLFSKILDLHRSATRKATSIYQFVSNKNISFHLW